MYPIKDTKKYILNFINDRIYKHILYNSIYAEIITKRNEYTISINILDITLGIWNKKYTQKTIDMQFNTICNKITDTFSIEFEDTITESYIEDLGNAKNHIDKIKVYTKLSKPLSRKEFKLLPAISKINKNINLKEYRHMHWTHLLERIQQWI